MTQSTIHPVILCGGSGTRLWPLSRQSYPKQFARLLGDRSLFQMAVARCRGDGFGAPVVVTGDAFRFIVTEQMAALRIDPGAILIEPEGRNTAPAVLAAALALAESDPQAVMLISPSDHAIADAAGFREVIRRARPAAKAGQIVTFGIPPTGPETGYGYLQLAEGGAVSADSPQPLAAFVEKPTRPEAARRIADGRHLWNAGLVLATARTVIAAFAQLAPQIHAAVSAAVAGAAHDLGFTRLAPAPWAEAPDISLDYAIMEQADNLSVMPMPLAWSDLGNWISVAAEGVTDAAGNVTHGTAHALDCENSLLRAESEGQVIVGLGLSDIIAVAMQDAVLVAHRDQAQAVGAVVDTLRAEGVAQATRLPRDYRPWGWYESLATGPRFQVKRIVVDPGGALSLQSHLHRSEHWIVVAGTARVTKGDSVCLVSENESIYIPLGTRHRLENPGKLPIVLIEVQTGGYLGEDDIKRHDDIYARD
jgi:mannose-1-phosphate guanylyltransferase/mannose-6-phosphate isomerase